MTTTIKALLASIGLAGLLAGCASYDYGYGYAYGPPYYQPYHQPYYGYRYDTPYYYYYYYDYGPYSYGPTYYYGAPAIGFNFDYRDYDRRGHAHGRHFDHRDRDYGDRNSSSGTHSRTNQPARTQVPAAPAPQRAQENARTPPTQRAQESRGNHGAAQATMRAEQQ